MHIDADCTGISSNSEGLCYEIQQILFQINTLRADPRELESYEKHEAITQCKVQLAFIDATNYSEQFCNIRVISE